MKTISVKLDDKIMEDAEQLAKEKNIGLEEFIQKALKDIIYFSRMNAMRDSLGKQIKNKGIENEDRLFEFLS